MFLITFQWSTINAITWETLYRFIVFSINPQSQRRSTVTECGLDMRRSSNQLCSEISASGWRSDRHDKRSRVVQSWHKQIVFRREETILGEDRVHRRQTRRVSTKHYLRLRTLSGVTAEHLRGLSTEYCRLCTDPRGYELLVVIDASKIAESTKIPLSVHATYRTAGNHPVKDLSASQHE